MLQGVGDAALGEWVEDGEIAYHIRRRMTAAEDALVGPVVDVRGTPEALQRFERVKRYLPPGLERMEIA